MKLSLLYYAVQSGEDSSSPAPVLPIARNSVVTSFRSNYPYMNQASSMSCLNSNTGRVHYENGAVAYLNAFGATVTGFTDMTILRFTTPTCNACHEVNLKSFDANVTILDIQAAPRGRWIVYCYGKVSSSTYGNMVYILDRYDPDYVRSLRLLAVYAITHLGATAISVSSELYAAYDAKEAISPNDEKTITPCVFSFGKNVCLFTLNNKLEVIETRSIAVTTDVNFNTSSSGRPFVLSDKSTKIEGPGGYILRKYNSAPKANLETLETQNNYLLVLKNLKPNTAYTQSGGNVTVYARRAYDNGLGYANFYNYNAPSSRAVVLYPGLTPATKGTIVRNGTTTTITTDANGEFCGEIRYSVVYAEDTAYVWFNEVISTHGTLQLTLNGIMPGDTAASNLSVAGRFINDIKSTITYSSYFANGIWKDPSFRTLNISFGGAATVMFNYDLPVGSDVQPGMSCGVFFTNGVSSNRAYPYVGRSLNTFYDLWGQYKVTHSPTAAVAGGTVLIDALPINNIATFTAQYGYSHFATEVGEIKYATETPLTTNPNFNIPYYSNRYGIGINVHMFNQWRNALFDTFPARNNTAVYCLLNGVPLANGTLSGMNTTDSFTLSRALISSTSMRIMQNASLGDTNVQIPGKTPGGTNLTITIPRTGTFEAVGGLSAPFIVYNGAGGYAAAVVTNPITIPKQNLGPSFVVNMLACQKLNEILVDM